jgi:hypothetical protein
VLIPAILRTSLLYGSLAGAALCVVVLWVREPAPRSALVKWLPAGGILVGLVLAIFMYMHDTQVLIVTSDGSSTSVSRSYAMTAVHYDLAPGHTEHSDNLGILDYLWVVNRSSHPVRIIHLEYGMSFGGSEPDELPPGTAAMFAGMEHIGPNDRPPSSVTTESKIGESRNWLTWD